MAELQQGSSFIKLNETNWNVWKFQTQLTLISKELFDVTSGSTVKPEAKADGYAAFIKKDAKAQEILVSRMEASSISHILSCTSAQEMWRKLHAVYERSSSVSIHLLQQQFYSLKFEDSVMNFLSKIQNLVAEIRQQGEEIPVKMVITKITMSLPEQFQHFVSAWESVADEQRTLDTLTARLLVEEERLKTREETVALTAKSKIKCFLCGKLGHKKAFCSRRNNQTNSQKNKNLICYFCGKKGHVSKDCYFRKNKNLGSSNSESSKGDYALMGLVDDTGSNANFYLDSGASEHMCNDISMFGKYLKLKEPKRVKIGNGSFISGIGIGSVFVKSFNEEKFLQIELQNVLHVPELEINLFSQGKALDKGVYMISDSESAKFVHRKSKEICAVAKRENKLFKMLFSVVKSKVIEQNVCADQENTCCVAETKKNDLTYWHERLAHQHFDHVKRVLTKNDIIWEKESPDNPFCDACVQGKQHRSPFQESKSKSTEICDLIHADLCGPIEVESIGKSRYMFVLKDDYSHFRKVYFLENKYQVHEKLSEFLLVCKNQLKKNVKVVRSDNGTEIKNRKIKELLISHGIEHQITVAYSPQQLGRVEREMRTIMEATRTMLLSANLEKKFWAEAANTAVYIINRTGTSSVKGSTPYELWTGKAFDPRSLKFKFGEQVWVHVPKEKRRKLDPKSEKGIFVGFGETTKGFRVYFSGSNTVTLHRDLIVNPNGSQYPKIENYIQEFEPDENIEVPVNNHQTGVDDDKGEDSSISQQCTMNDLCNNQATGTDVDSSSEDSSDSKPGYTRMTLRPRDQLKKPSRYPDCETSYISVTDVEEPTTYQEAMKSTSSKKWKQAIDAELAALSENETWDIVDEPSDCEVIDSKWVFKIKRDNKGNISSFKCRLVARGFQQKNLMFEDLYSPVAKLNTLRILLAISVNFDWVIYQMDVCSAFLHGEIKEDLYMYLPENCNLPSGKVCKLKKAIYGLKRAPKYWYEKFHDFMLSQKFVKSDNDHCLYFRITETSKLYLLIFVDDLVLTGSDSKQIDDLKSEMNKNFKMKDLGPVSYYLGISISQNTSEGILTLDQSNYLENVLKRFNMFDCKVISTPMDNKFDYNSLSKEKFDNSCETVCRQIIGCVMYAMLGSRPDLCNSISILSRYQNYGNYELLVLLKRVLRYIKGTIDLKLVYRKNSNSELVRGFVDADWGGDGITRKSTTGYCFQIYDCSVIWCSKQQTCVALSSTEAEYIALSQSVVEACWLHNLLLEMKVRSCENLVIPIYEDNQSAIRIGKSCEQPKRLKHINVKYHFVQEKVKDKTVSILFLPSSEQIADLLTKPLGRVLFEKFRKLMVG